MRTYNAWFPRYALGNRLMFFCPVFSPAVGRGSSALSTFLDRRTQRVKKKDILRYHFDYYDNLVTIAMRYLVDAYCPKEALSQILTQ